MSAKLCVLFLAACGRIDFDAVSDAGRGAGPFGGAQLLENVNSPFGDDDPAISGDGLDLVFDSERSGVSDLWETQRPDRTAPWPVPTLIAELATPQDEDGPWLSPDALTLTYGSSRSGTSGGEDLWITTRPDRASPWAAPTRVAELASTAGDERLSISADGLHGVLTSDRAGPTGVYDLYTTQRASVADAWDPPAPIAELDTASYEGFAVLDTTGTIVYFESNRPGSESHDLWIATRPSEDAPFGPPERIAELDTSASESDPSVTADLHMIFFTRGLDVDRDIYFAER